MYFSSKYSIINTDTGKECLSMSTESLYEKICQAMQGGGLPADFHLRSFDNDKELHFADGAMDGTVRYHFGKAKAVDINGLCRALQEASEGKTSEAEKSLQAYFSGGHLMLQMLDPMQDWIYANSGSLAPDKLGCFARQLLTGSSDIESIKFAFALLEVLDEEPDAHLREVILVLARSDEFTLFALFLISSWPEADEIIFALAQELQGWGRIHTVQFLHPTNARMKKWLLQHGYENTVMPEYSALACAKKGDLLGFLQVEKLGSAGFAIATRLMSHLLDQGPVPGLGKYKAAGELLAAYLAAAESLADAVSEYDLIFSIKEYITAGELPEKAELLASCEKILVSENCQAKAAEAAATGENLYFAKKMGQPYAEKAYAKLCEDFYGSYDLVDLLLPEKLYAAEIVELFANRLPLEDMATGPAQDMGYGEQYRDYGVLSYVVQFLQHVPGKGEKLLLCALDAPVIGCRNIALNTLEAWRKVDYPLSPQLASALAHLQQVEPDAKTRSRLEHY